MEWDNILCVYSIRERPTALGDLLFSIYKGLFFGQYFGRRPTPNPLKLAILEGIISEMNHSRPAGDGSGGRVFPRRPAARFRA